MSHKHEKYQRLIDAAKALQPVTTAIVHPCDESSLSGAVDAAKLGGSRHRLEAGAVERRVYTPS